MERSTLSGFLVFAELLMRAKPAVTQNVTKKVINENQVETFFLDTKTKQISWRCVWPHLRICKGNRPRSLGMAFLHFDMGRLKAHLGNGFCTFWRG